MIAIVNAIIRSSRTTIDHHSIIPDSQKLHLDPYLPPTSRYIPIFI